MPIFKVTVDAYRGTSKKVPPKRTTLTFLVDAVDLDASEDPAMQAASAFTAGYRVRAVEWRMTSRMGTEPICIKRTNKGIWA